MRALELMHILFRQFPKHTKLHQLLQTIFCWVNLHTSVYTLWDIVMVNVIIDAHISVRHYTIDFDISPFQYCWMQHDKNKWMVRCLPDRRLSIYDKQRIDMKCLHFPGKKISNKNGSRSPWVHSPLLWIDVNCLSLKLWYHLDNACALSQI